jgi:(p)ppGpp synthase/HD superfamily hydrolase
MSTADVSVTDINSHLDERTDEVNIRLQVAVRDYQHLSDLLSKLNTIPNVFEARRLADKPKI